MYTTNTNSATITTQLSGIVVVYVVYYVLVVVNYVVGGVITSAPPPVTHHLPQIPRREGIPIPRGVVILAWYFVTTAW